MPYEIYMSDLDGNHNLPDGDYIRMDVVSSNCKTPPLCLEMGLQLEGVAWWKGVLLENGIVLAQCQDTQIAQWSAIDWTTYNLNQLQLWQTPLALRIKFIELSQ